MTARDRFQAQFGQAARSLRASLGARRVVTGLSYGLAIAGALALLFWRVRPELRMIALAAPMAGFAVALLIDRRRRLSDEHVAILLDRRLESSEVITTAVGAAGAGDGSGGGEEDGREAIARAVLERATEALRAARMEDVRLPVLRKQHGIGAVGLAALAFAFRLAPSKPVLPPPPPGTEIVQTTEVKGLEKVIALGELDPRDDAQRERLKKLAADAEKIRDALRKGEAKRDAEADLAKLADAITAERMSLGDGDERKGLEAAIGALGKNGDLSSAAKALGDHDLVQMDREMERLADQAEGDSRERAKKSLEEAEEAAKKAGSKSVAKALADQRKRLEQTIERRKALKELAEAMGKDLSPDGKKALEGLEKGDPAAAQKLAEAMGDALEKLTPEERKRLAERLKELAKNADGAGGKLGDLSKQLDSPQDLEKTLKDLANAPPPSEEAQRQQALDDAQKQMGGALMAPGAGAGSGGSGDSPGSVGPGGNSGRSPSASRPASPTDKIDGPGLRSRADAPLGAGTPMPGVVGGRAPGRTGETANVRGTGALGTVGPDEVGGVSRSEVPEAYREQVGRYFEP